MSTYEISKSSLLSLKAEILRKQEELSKTKAENEVKIKNLKKIAPLEIKNKGLDDRQKNDISEEDEDLMKKSRSALEAKTKLYDKLSKQKSTDLTDEQIEYNRRYLVRFERKSNNFPPEESDDEDIDKYPEDRNESYDYEEDDPLNPDEEWVEYVDCLGRTRTCLRKDLDHIKSRDRDLKVTVNENRRIRSESPVRPPPSPSPPHNEDIQITEDSELLSNDMRQELLRRQWEKEEEELKDKTDIHYQDILFNEARTHGVGYYGFSKDEDERAKQQEALHKLREETKEQQKKAQNMKAMREKQLAMRIKAAKNRKRARLGLPPEEDEPEPELPPVEPSPSIQEEESKKEDEEKTKTLEKMRKNHIRPWDIGKEGVRNREHYEYSQEEWVDKKRKERPGEFAPPLHFDTDKSLRFTSKKTKDLPQPKQPVNPYKARNYQPAPIVNECSESEEELDSSSSNYHLKTGVEIAPPPTYDYYGPSDAKRAKATKANVNVGDSIEAGLRFLREQAERKSGSYKHSEDMFLS